MANSIESSVVNSERDLMTAASFSGRLRLAAAALALGAGCVGPSSDDGVVGDLNVPPSRSPLSPDIGLTADEKLNSTRATLSRINEARQNMPLRESQVEVIPTLPDQSIDIGDLSRFGSRADIKALHELMNKCSEILKTSNVTGGVERIEKLSAAEEEREALVRAPLEEVAKATVALEEVERVRADEKSETERLRVELKNLEESLNPLPEEPRAQQANYRALKDQFGAVEKKSVELEAAMALLQKRLEDLCARRILEVELVAIDVYKDGILGRDCWSTRCEVNGKTHVVWESNPNISDNGQRAGTPGPNGDKNYTTYLLTGTTYPVELAPDEHLKVAFCGTAHDANHPVERTEIVLTPESSWGVGGDPGTWAYNGKHTHRIGGFNSNTEYYLYFWVRDVAK